MKRSELHEKVDPSADTVPLQSPVSAAATNLLTQAGTWQTRTAVKTNAGAVGASTGRAVPDDWDRFSFAERVPAIPPPIIVCGKLFFASAGICA